MGDEPLDEFGLPEAWRRKPPLNNLLDVSKQAWPAFATWCEDNGLNPFPASTSAVLEFLMDPPVSGPALYEAWRAIEARHEAYYWHTNANPVQLLRFGRGVYVEEDGTVHIPDPPIRNIG